MLFSKIKSDFKLHLQTSRGLLEENCNFATYYVIWYPKCIIANSGRTCIVLVEWNNLIFWLLYHKNNMKMLVIEFSNQLFCVCYGNTYIKIGTIQRRLAWPLRKDDTQIREAFQKFFFFHNNCL